MARFLILIVSVPFIFTVLVKYHIEVSNTGIYIVISPTNKIYVGQSWNLECRESYYRRLKCKEQPKLYNSLKKHGWEAHKFEIAIELRDDISQDTLDCWEWYFYDLYKANHKLMNLREPGSRGRHSEETKRKMSESKKNKTFSEQHLLNLRIASKKRYGDRPVKIKTGALKGCANPKSKRVLQYDLKHNFIKEWGAVMDIERTLGIKAGRISDVCLGKRNKCKGFLWEYKKV